MVSINNKQVANSDLNPVCFWWQEVELLGWLFSIHDQFSSHGESSRMAVDDVASASAAPVAGAFDMLLEKNTIKYLSEVV